MRSCERAHALCRKLPHCVKVDANRDGTWATLKSLTVFAPPPVAACEGYAFRLDGPGGAPNPFAAPPVADFSFDDVHGGAPDENWCYRGTTVDEGERRRFRRKQPGHACTMETCFDATRCEKRFGFHVGEEVPRTHDMMRLPDCLRQASHELLQFGLIAALIQRDAETAGICREGSIRQNTKVETSCSRRLMHRGRQGRCDRHRVEPISDIDLEPQLR